MTIKRSFTAWNRASVCVVDIRQTCFALLVYFLSYPYGHTPALKIRVETSPRSLTASKMWRVPSTLTCIVR
jgi:hypothetical protein